MPVDGLPCPAAISFEEELGIYYANQVSQPDIPTVSTWLGRTEVPKIVDW
ncbi:MAG: hypothetical protein J0H18_18095 [Rhizobiales bacterium]|nr:hypothetical protein [Hyphomicrobiales bacterium]